jgi:hypothetical protein
VCIGSLDSELQSLCHPKIKTNYILVNNINIYKSTILFNF